MTSTSSVPRPESLIVPDGAEDSGLSEEDELFQARATLPWWRRPSPWWSVYHLYAKRQCHQYPLQVDYRYTLHRDVRGSYHGPQN